MASYTCQLCGGVVIVQRPTGNRNHFCNGSHKTEYYHNMKLSASQIEILAHLSDSPKALAKTNTVYKLSDENKQRKMPLIKHLGDNLYEITEIGLYFLKQSLDKD